VGDESEAAAIEYALLALDVRNIIVMGHSACGAMKAVLTGQVPAEALNLERWLVHARTAGERLAALTSIDRHLAPEDRLSRANVLLQLEHVRSCAPVADRLARSEVELHGAWFDVERADLHIWNVRKDRFFRMDEAAIPRALAAPRA